MPVDRPTFSESWYRVAEMRPKLRSTVQVFRQHFRGRMWHVVQDPSNNQFFRLNDAAYRMVALLDGRRSVSEAWKICNEQLGDEAPTQGEAIQLLGQLYTSNLLQAEIPPDAEGLFRRYNKRIQREIQGYLMNLLFIRIPLFDPNHLLDSLVGTVGKIFTWYGFVVWLAMVCAGGYFLTGRMDELSAPAQGILSTDNLPLLYLSFTLIKILHEFGHAFACKKFGRDSGSGGEVHVMGVMFLVFTPLPYVDASSSWAFRSKWRRAMVGAAGMYVEIAAASIAAMIWANTSQGPLHAIMYNVMFIASFSTIVFNGNPLLRYDAYYILSDVLEIPNLAQRSKNYLYYLVRRYVWNVRQAINPAHTTGEKIWFVGYGIASTIYRTIVCVAILLFVMEALPVAGVVLATAAFIAWVLVPLGKFVHYLASSGELLRVRTRACLSTAGFLGAVLLFVGLAPMPDRVTAEGVVEPDRIAFIHAGEDGFVENFLPTGSAVTRTGPALLQERNPELASQRDELSAERRRLVARRRLAEKEDLAAGQVFAKQIEALDVQIARVQKQIDELTLLSPISGTWVSPEVDRLRGSYVKRGQQLGLVASLDDMIVRAVAGQDVAGRIVEEIREGGIDSVEYRVKGRPETHGDAVIREILPAGQEQLPSQALGYAAGGSVATEAQDTKGVKTTERFFEIRVKPSEGSDGRLLSGQRVVVRFHLAAKPLGEQWWRAILQLVQRRLSKTT
jgi:putative peptide zinc metalloprotease protein